MSVRDYVLENQKKNYNLNIDQKDLKNIKQEFDRIYKLFIKKNILIDDINFNIDISYHDIEDLYRVEE